MSVTSDTRLALGGLTTAVSLTADNQAVTVGDACLLAITSDNTTATNRTFTLSVPAYNGQQLTLLMVSAASTTCELADSGACNLSATWTPLVGDTLTLIGYTSVWYEVTRADN